MEVSHGIWHVTPSAAPASRRSVLLGLAVALFASGCAEQRVAPIDAEPAFDPIFFKLSQALTGHQDLDPVTSARLSAAFATIAPDVHARFSDLARLRAADPQSLLAAAASDGLKFAALAIVAAWYTGSIGRGSRTVTVGYRDALMQRSVEDAMLPPTYALGGPGWWSVPPPAIGDRPAGAQYNHTNAALAMANRSDPK